MMSARPRGLPGPNITLFIFAFTMGIAACGSIPDASSTEPPPTPTSAETATPASTPTPAATATPMRDTQFEYSTVDRPDDTDDYQVHFIYVIPKDGDDDFPDADGRLEISTKAMNYWLAEQTGRSTLRLDTYNGVLDATFLRLDVTAAEFDKTGFQGGLDYLENVIKRLGFNHPKKLYVILYDGVHHTEIDYCGLGPWPPELLGNTVGVFLRAELGGRSCPRAFADSEDRADYFEQTYLHEVLHTLGLAPACGANQDDEGSHVDDDLLDLMYGGSQPLGSIKLDVGNDDYYNHGIPNCPDLAKSVFLDPQPEDVELPPRWEESVANLPYNSLEFLSPLPDGTDPSAALFSNLLFQDDFSDPASGWPQDQSGDDVADYQDNGYRISINGAGADFWANPGLNLTDLTVEVDAAWNAPPSESTYGLICRYVDEYNFYFTILDADGYFLMGKYKNGIWDPISPGWAYSPFITQGLNTNHLRLDCVGDTLSFHVNGQKIAEVRDSDFSAGDVGIIAGTFDEPNADVLFDNFTVTGP